MRFDGATYEAGLDQARLSGQLERVEALMKDGRWRTLREISQVVEGTEAGVSARLRDLRKKRFGGYTVNRRRRNDIMGLYEYQVVAPAPKAVQARLFN